MRMRCEKGGFFAEGVYPLEGGRTLHFNKLGFKITGASKKQKIDELSSIDVSNVMDMSCAVRG